MRSGAQGLHPIHDRFVEESVNFESSPNIIVQCQVEKRDFAHLTAQPAGAANRKQVDPFMTWEAAEAASTRRLKVSMKHQAARLPCAKIEIPRIHANVLRLSGFKFELVKATLSKDKT